jgi:hypothetical protein
MKTTTQPKKDRLTKLVVERFITVIMRDSTAPDNVPYALQVNGQMGKLLTFHATPEIWKRVLGTMEETAVSTRKNLGLRQLADVRFALHLEDAKAPSKCQKIVGIDIIPRRMHPSGAAPVSWGDAKKKGFIITWDEEINGFDTLDEKEERRGAYAGMTERELSDVLDAVRGADWKTSSTQTLSGHKVTKDGFSYLVKPLRVGSRASR